MNEHHDPTDAVLDDVAIGLTSFLRREKVETCLRSIIENPHEFSRVIVADNGGIGPEKRRVYERFRKRAPLEVLDLDDERGTGASRNAIVEELDEPYLLLVDDDMTVPSSVETLRRILDARPDLGGVAGIHYQGGILRAWAHDLFLEETAAGSVLVSDRRADKSSIVDTPYGEKRIFEYEFIPNCVMFRRECLEDSRWDPEFKMAKEHVDFYLDHKLNSDWSFALTEEAVFPHYPGGSDEYDNARWDDEVHRESMQYLFDKWGIEGHLYKRKFHRPKVNKRPLSDRIRKTFVNHLPAGAIVTLQRLLGRYPV